jgi:hypothetical protein
MAIRSTAVILAATSILGTHLAAQARIGFQAGLASATLGGADAGTPGSRMGVHAGGFATVPVSSIVTLQGGVAWVEKGIEEQIDADLLGTVALSYLEFPMLIRVAIPSQAVVGAHVLVGAVLSYEVSCEVRAETLGGQRAAAPCDSPLLGGGLPTKPTDFGFMLGGGITLLPRNRLSYFVQVAYELGIQSIDDSDPQFDVKNRAILFAAGVTFSLAR